MDKIRKHEYRSQFTDDIVDIIQNHMILVDPSKRASSKSLQEEFTKIDNKCQSDQNYCTILENTA
ncbi:hypothetical protein F4782DRAFT_447928 [Xylaria castorea]|nr:hypothetical protein F4782DRAFT_447928 [Xylaria castorea]